MIDIEDVFENDNVAELLDDEQLASIGSTLKDQIDNDEMSREGWIDSQDEWLKLAAQVKEDKSFPWPNAANVKFPLMTTATMQFHARALPNLIDPERPVRAKVRGRDLDGSKAARAERISKWQSYDIMEHQSEWYDEMDRLLFVLPIVGVVYKKVYWSEIKGRKTSQVVLPQDLIINYDATTFEFARKTHCIPLSNNDLVTNQRAGFYLNVPLESSGSDYDTEVRDETLGLTDAESEDDEGYLVYESHTFMDLDEDGYEEPYIITIDSRSGTVLRITANFEPDNVIYNEAGEVVRIVPNQHFTQYMFLPDPNSSVYGIGFGTLLGPTNEAVNTLINQLIDGGTLANTNGGFLGRGIHLSSGNMSFSPNEWKKVNNTGDDLRKGIFPLPVREPSGVLFNLLGMLVDSAKQISSVSDMMAGETPGQNTPATTSMAVLEQGLKVFSSIYKRIHRSLTRELRLMYKLDSVYLDEEEYNVLLDEDEQYGLDDFTTERLDIFPTSDSQIVSDLQRVMKSQALLEKLQMGLPLNPQVVLKRVLEAEQHEGIEELMTLPEPQPSIEEKEFELKLVQEERETIDSYVNNIKTIAEAESLEMGDQLNMYRAVVEDILKTHEAENGQNAGAGAKPTG